MQVSVESTSPLARRMTVGVSKEKIQTEIDKRLQSLGTTAKINGFRPGKIPKRVLMQRYGNQVRQEVLGEMVQSSFYEALQQEQLHIAGEPEIKFNDDVAQDDDLSYTASFEVYPEFTVNADNLGVEKPTASISDADVDSMLQKLREQQQTWEVVERAATNDDRILVNMNITSDETTITQPDVEKMPILVKTGDMLIPGMSAQLEGMSASERREFEGTFPADHPNTEIAGKKVKVALEAVQIEMRQLPDIDAEFAKSLGVEDGDVERLRLDVHENMQRELGNAVKLSLKSQLLDALVANNELELPTGLVEREAARLRENQQKAAAEQNVSMPQMEASELQAQAQKRVKLGLLINALVKKHQIQPSSEKIRAAVEQIAKPYEDREAVINWYYSNPDNLRDVEALVLEEQVVDVLLEQAVVNEQESTFERIMERYREQAKV